MTDTTDRTGRIDVNRRLAARLPVRSALPLAVLAAVVLGVVGGWVAGLAGAVVGAIVGVALAVGWAAFMVAGATATTSLVPGNTIDEKWKFIHDGLSKFAGRTLPPSGLANRVLIAVQNPSASGGGALGFVDAYYDIRYKYNSTNTAPAFSIAGYSGNLPISIQNMPEEQEGDGAGG